MEGYSLKRPSYSFIFAILAMAILIVVVRMALWGYDISSPWEIAQEVFAPTSTPVSIIIPPANTPTPSEVATPATTTPSIVTILPSPTSTATTFPTLSPTGTPTSTPIPEAVVDANELNLRTGPGVVYNIIGVLHQGDNLEIQGRTADNKWLQVASANLDVLGWVSVEFISIINTDLNTIPIAVIPPTPSSTPTPLIKLTPASFLTYSAPILTSPDNGVGTFGVFPSLSWKWNGQLAADEYFEVRVWHESITSYQPALGWVKEPPFDFNISQERQGKYYWTVIIVKGRNARLKDWIVQSGWPYKMWDGELVEELSLEPEPRYFFFTPEKNLPGAGSAISEPPPAANGGN